MKQSPADPLPLEYAQLLRSRAAGDPKWDWLAQETAITLERQFSEIKRLRRALEPFAATGRIAISQRVKDTDQLELAGDDLLRALKSAARAW